MSILDKIILLPYSSRRYELLQPDTKKALQSLGVKSASTWLEKNLCSPIGSEWTTLFLSLNPNWEVFERWVRLSKEHCLVAIGALAELAPHAWEECDRESRMPEGADPHKVKILVDHAVQEIDNPRICGDAEKILEAWPDTTRSVVLPKPKTLGLGLQIPRLSKRDKEILSALPEGPWQEHSVSEKLQLTYLEPNLLMLGVIRRMLHGELADLLRATVTTTRLVWNSYAKVRPKNRVGEGLWDYCLYGLAINDWDYATRVANEISGHSNSTHEKFPELVMFDVLSALIKNEFGPGEERMLEAHGKSWRTNAFFRRIGECFRAIGLGDQDRFAKALMDLGKTFRRQGGLICLEAHGIWRLANRCDARLTHHFNVDAAFPWDSGFHKMIDLLDDPLELLDLDSIHPKIVKEFAMLDPVSDF